MEFKHSPAPWHLRGGVIKNSLLIDDNHNVVASFLTEIKEEDANLIAAAPELLEALIEIVGNHYLSDKAQLMATNAIARALGQQ
ncbi:hypothetical protein [Proteus mirabilis]|uniref:hypothetical protein n=1 Tax=Proteus mirabilis TaxID=584 RepID=UPI0034D77720